MLLGSGGERGGPLEPILCLSARQAVTEGLAIEKALREIAEGWRRWAAHPDAWYAVLHGEILCRA